MQGTVGHDCISQPVFYKRKAQSERFDFRGADKSLAVALKIPDNAVSYNVRPPRESERDRSDPISCNWRIRPKTVIGGGD
jgi:hypothetical protein